MRKKRSEKTGKKKRKKKRKVADPVPGLRDLVADTVHKFTCTKCGKTKKAGKFYNDHRKKSGKSSWCIPCHKKAADKYIAANKKKIKKAVARYYKKLREESPPDRTAKRLYVENLVDGTQLPLVVRKADISMLVHFALRTGQIAKYKYCQFCITKGKLKGKTFAFHRSEENLLDLVWLCPACHSRARRGLIDMQELSLITPNEFGQNEQLPKLIEIAPISIRRYSSRKWKDDNGASKNTK